MVRSEGNMSLKNPVTPPGMDPGTVRVVAQRLKHYAAPDPTNVRYLPNFVKNLLKKNFSVLFMIEIKQSKKLFKYSERKSS
jgi:hypothetical protein